MVAKTQSLEIRYDEDGNTLAVQVYERAGLQAESLGLITWGASFVLANLLYKWKSLVPASEPNSSILPVIELGAGTSLVGISAAAVWQVSVIVTDLAPIIQGLADNVAANEALLAERKASVRAGALDWHTPQKLTLDKDEGTISAADTKARILLASDTLYDEDHPGLQVDTITAWLAPGPDSRVIFCYVLRHAYVDHIRNFWELLQEAGLECVEEGRQDAGQDQWDEVAPYEWCVWQWKRDS